MFRHPPKMYFNADSYVLTMLVQETVLSRQMSAESTHAYADALRLLETARSLGTLSEKKNAYQTDGPRHRLEIAFDVTVPVDAFCRAVLSATLEGDIQGDQGTLHLSLDYVIETAIEETGTFSELFAQFYLAKFYNKNRERAQHVIERTNTVLQHALASLCS